MVAAQLAADCTSNSSSTSTISTTSTTSTTSTRTTSTNSTTSTSSSTCTFSTASTSSIASSTSMEAFKGKYERVSEEQYEAFLKALGLNAVMRAAATASSPRLELTERDGEWTNKTSTLLKTLTLTYRLGQEFDYKTTDGRDTRALVTFEEGRIVAVQRAIKEGERTTRTFMEMVGPDELVYTLTVEGVEGLRCVQRFKRVA